MPRIVIAEKTFKTERRASGAGDADTFQPVDLLAEWITELKPSHLVNVQQVYRNYAGPQDITITYLVCYYE
jgi:hypothetical protein